MADLSRAKFCIIAVHGNVLDKIGFDIAERANRSEELRLKRTLTMISNLEQKDEHRFRKEKHNLKTQLERLKTCQLNRKRELIKKSFSEGNSLERISAGRRFNQRRMTSAALYEHSFRFGEVGSPESSPENVVEFSVSTDDDLVRLNSDHNYKASQIHRSNTSASSGKFPGISRADISTEQPHEATGSIASCTTRAEYNTGSLRRQLTEPDLCSGSLIARCHSRGAGRSDQRPSSAHTLPKLPISHHLVQQRNGEEKFEPSPDQKGRKSDPVGDDDSGAVKNRTHLNRYHKLLPVMKAHLKASTICVKVVQQENASESENIVSRRRSLDENTSLPRRQDNMESKREEKTTRKHQLTPRSYFKRYGVPLERSELLQILLEEREILQQRIKEFLAKQNP